MRGRFRQGCTEVPHLDLHRHVLQCILWSHLQAKLPLATPSSWENLWPGRDAWWLPHCNAEQLANCGCKCHLFILRCEHAPTTPHHLIHLHLFPRSCSMHLKHSHHSQTGMLSRAVRKWHGRPTCLPSNTKAGPSKFAWKLTGYAVALWISVRARQLMGTSCSLVRSFNF